MFAAAVTGWLIPFSMAYMSVDYDNAHVQGATVLEVRGGCMQGHTSAAPYSGWLAWHLQSGVALFM